MKRSGRVVHRKLGVEELEQRVAPVVLTGGEAFEFREADGDLIGVSLEGSGAVELLDAAGGDPDGTNAAAINVSGTDLSSSLSIVVREAVADGAANLGNVNASGLTLGALNIEGNVRRVTASAIGEVNISGDVLRTMRLAHFDETSFITVGGSVYALDVGGGLNGTVNVADDVMAINMGTDTAPTFDITQITDDDFNNVNPVVNCGKIAFISINNPNETDLPGTLMVWDGTQLIEVAQGATEPSIYNNQIAFVHGTGEAGAIFLAEIGETPVQIANGSSPWLWNGKIAFSSGQNENAEIYLYDGSDIIQITDNDTPDTDPCLWGNVISWVGVDPVEGDTEIFMYKCGEIIQITDNSVDDTEPCGPWNFLTFTTVDPEEGDTEIALYRGSSVEVITDNDVDDMHPTYSCITYQHDVGENAQVAYWNKAGSTIVDAGEKPFLRGGLIAYQKYDGHDYEIFLARVCHQPGPSSSGTVNVEGNLDSLATTGSLARGGSVKVGGDLGFTWLLGDMRGAIDAGGDLVNRAIIRGALAGQLAVGGDMLGQVTVTSNAGVRGRLMAGGSISNVNISVGDLDGIIHAGGDIGVVTIGGDLDGRMATLGATTGRTLVKGDLNGVIFAKCGVGANVVVKGDLNGGVCSGRDIAGNVVAYGDLAGRISASANILGNVVIRGENGVTGRGTIAARRMLIGNVCIAKGDLAGRVCASVRTGNLHVVGDLSGVVYSQYATFGNTSVRGNLSGVLNAGCRLNGNVWVAGDISGQIVATRGLRGRIVTAGNLSGSIACSSGYILSTIVVQGPQGITETGRIYAKTCMGGVISVRNGDFAGTIETDGSLFGKICIVKNIASTGTIRVASNMVACSLIHVGGDVLTPGRKSISVGNNLAGRIWIRGDHHGTLEIGNSVFCGGVVRARNWDQVEIGLLQAGGTIRAGGMVLTASPGNGSITIGAEAVFGCIARRWGGWQAVTLGANA